MLNMLCHLLLTVLMLAADCRAAEPYPLLKATKGDTTFYLLPSAHSTTALMRARFEQTLACMPTVGAIALEITSDRARRFDLSAYALDANRAAPQHLPPGLLAQLNDIGNRLLNRRRFPLDFIRSADQRGIHPGLLLYILGERVLAPEADGEDMPSGPAFEQIATHFAQQRRLSLFSLEDEHDAPNAYFSLSPADYAAWASFLVETAQDGSKQRAVARAMRDVYRIFARPDWTTIDTAAIAAQAHTGQSKGYVQRIIVERTQAMVAHLLSLPHQSSPVLVAIGLGHFSRVDGIESELLTHGFTMTRFMPTCPPNAK